MKGFISFIKSALKSEFLLWVFSLFVFLSFFILLYNHLPPQIPLFYSRPSSDRQVTDLFMTGLIPFTSLSLLIINKAIARRFFSGEEIIQKLIYIINIIIVLVSTYIFVKIFLLVS